jgi:LysR family transcriptional regulator, hydrogen peroxide-inducible genes activator
VGITLLPTLAIKPPVARTDNVHLLEFAGHPPSRRIALAWRKSSSMGTFLQRFAAVIRDLPATLLQPDIADAKPARQSGR